MDKKDKDKQEIDAVKALELLFAAHYISKKKLYLANFLRGIFFGAGSVLGATIVISLVLWLLSLFDTVPLIGPLLDKAAEDIQQR